MDSRTVVSARKKKRLGSLRLAPSRKTLSACGAKSCCVTCSCRGDRTSQLTARTLEAAPPPLLWSYYHGAVGAYLEESRLATRPPRRGNEDGMCTLKVALEVHGRVCHVMPGPLPLLHTCTYRMCYVSCPCRVYLLHNKYMMCDTMLETPEIVSTCRCLEYLGNLRWSDLAFCLSPGSLAAFTKESSWWGGSVWTGRYDRFANHWQIRGAAITGRGGLDQRKGKPPRLPWSQYHSAVVTPTDPHLRYSCRRAWRAADLRPGRKAVERTACACMKSLWMCRVVSVIKCHVSCFSAHVSSSQVFVLCLFVE